MSNFTIRARLIFLSGLLLAILAATATFLTHELLQDSGALSEEAGLVAVVRSTDNARQHFSELKYWLNDFATTLAGQSQSNVETVKVKLDEDLKAIAPVDATSVAKVQNDLNALGELVQQAGDAYYSKDDALGGNALMAQAQSHIGNVNKEFDEIVGRIEQLAFARRDATIGSAKSAVSLSIISGIIALALALIVTALIVQSITAPLRRLEISINAITAGSLDAVIPKDGRDEIGRMANALMMLRDSLIQGKRLQAEREKAEAKARQAQTRLAEAIEIISEGFALYDSEDRLVICNKRFKEMYAGAAVEIRPGVPYESIVRALADAGIVKDTSSEHDSWIAERLERHRNPGGAFEQRRSSGMWLKISERRTADGGVVSVFTDITEQKEREFELGHLVDRLADARDAATEATVAKSRFLANMSHELRTPLNAIIGITEMLVEDAEDQTDRGALEPLERIGRAGRHLLQLINEILDLSKIEAGKLELNYEQVELALLIRDVVGEAESLAQKNNNKLLVECHIDLGVIRTDPTRLRQIVLNLLSNACKFTQNGTVSLDVSRIADGNDDRILIRVADTGIGMTEEQMGKLFQEFSQADSSTTRKYGGTGLGLAISDRLCRLMSGSIKVESQPNVGTTFIVSLPADRADVLDVAPAKAVARQEPGRTSRVLVIDDDATVRDLMRRFLSREGFDVVTAAGGHEGLEFARDLRPSVITLDVFMPDMDGWSVLQALKQDANLARIPVIMMTISDEKQKGFTLGASGYLTKPVDRGRLAEILDRFKSAAATSTVLIVEDDESTRDLMRRLLIGEGWRVHVAGNGRQALERAKIEPPNLVLLDLMMPEMDGFEFLVEFRKAPEFVSVPVIVVTGADLNSHDRRRLDGGVQHILQKATSSRDDFLRQIRTLVAQYVTPTALKRMDS